MQLSRLGILINRLLKPFLVVMRQIWVFLSFANVGRLQEFRVRLGVNLPVARADMFYRRQARLPGRFDSQGDRGRVALTVFD